MLRTPTILIAALLAVVPSSQAPNTVTRESTTTAKVDRLERSSRTVTLRAEGNVLTTVYVDPAMTVFDDLRVGDLVTVRYTESVIVALRPGAKLHGVQDTTEAARKQDETVFDQQKAIVTIEAIDAQRLVVTYRTSGNMRGFHTVQNKALLEGIRAGDRVEITLTRARAVSIDRKR
jgi:Cu/Ag efflux protein CusF